MRFQTFKIRDKFSYKAVCNDDIHTLHALTLDVCTLDARTLDAHTLDVHTCVVRGTGHSLKASLIRKHIEDLYC